MHESGSLFYMRARYYDASIGRFLSEDPSGFVDGPNLFAYVANNPVNFVDPLGLYKYSTTNLGIAFLHESNPFNTDGGFYQQANSIGSFLGGDLAGAAATSGQSIVETSNTSDCGKEKNSGWQNAYNAAQVTAGVAVSVATGKIAYDSARAGLILLNQNRYLRIGMGRKGGEKVLRIAGEWLKKLTGRSKIDLWKGGPL